MNKIIHRERIPLRATPEQVREFIMTPARVLEYYPDAINGEVLEPGHSLFCCGKAGVSLLERLPAECSEHKVVIKVTTAMRLNPPYTADAIREARFFTMIEDWELEATERGCVLTKTWRDLEKHRMRLLPMAMIVRRSAKAETAHLQMAWDQAAG
ncbi:MAG: SRPBCC family protein [Gammaproteobacteria bacterium]|nr:SRPBCC family protein [Gammaproteobacteria bacterium]